MRVGRFAVELGATALGTKIGMVQIADFIDASARAEQINLVELVDAVPSCIAVKARVDAVDEQSPVRHMAVKDVVFVAVFDNDVLVRVAGSDAVGVAAVAFPRVGLDFVVAVVSSDVGNVVYPVAIFVFHVYADLLRRLSSAAHEVPRAYWVDAATVMVQVGCAQRMVHFMAKCADVEIASDFELQVEIIDLQVMERHVTVEDAPTMRPE